jgi:phosphoglycolate phosphatase
MNEMAAAGTSAPKALLFDLDGTLADTPRVIVEILTTVLADLNVRTEAGAVRATVGQPLARGLGGLLGLPPEHADVKAAAASYQKLFGAYVQSNGPALSYPGVSPGLASLRAAGSLLAVTTSKPRGAALRMLRLMGIESLFAVVAGDDTVQQGKPAPDMALHAADALAVPPGECVVIGDGIADVAMAVAAGMRVIGVSYGVTSRQELISVGAETVVDSFGDLVSLLLGGYPKLGHVHLPPARPRPLTACSATSTYRLLGHVHLPPD